MRDAWWLGSGLVILLAALVGVSWYGWEAIQEQEDEIDTLRHEIETLQHDSDTRQQSIFRLQLDIPILRSNLDTVEIDLRDMRQEVDDIRSELGTRPLPISGRTIWEMVDELYATIPDLVTTPAAGVCVTPDDATLIQDIRSLFNERLDREPSDEELSEFLVEYRALHDDACASNVAANCIVQGRDYFTYTSECS